MTKKDKALFPAKGIVATPYEPGFREKKKPVKMKPLNAEMGVRQKRALQHLLDDGDITQEEFDTGWAKIVARVKAGLRG